MKFAFISAAMWLIGLSALAERRAALYAGPPEWWSWSARWRNRVGRRMRGIGSARQHAVAASFFKERRTHLARA